MDRIVATIFVVDGASEKFGFPHHLNGKDKGESEGRKKQGFWRLSVGSLALHSTGGNICNLLAKAAGYPEAEDRNRESVEDTKNQYDDHRRELIAQALDGQVVEAKLILDKNEEPKGVHIFASARDDAEPTHWLIIDDDGPRLEPK